MRIAIIYVFPDMLLATYVPLAQRFVKTYIDNPPGEADHEIHVAVKLGIEREIPSYTKLFRPLSIEFHMHGNVGKDIGSYQILASQLQADLIVCLGAPIHFTRAGWLDRIVQVYEENGPALYGCWGFHQPADHIRTTAFWCPPQLLASYPISINNDNRYEFEHGRQSITAHVRSMGLEAYMVTWNGAFPRDEWKHVDRKESLFLDQHWDRNV